MTDYTYKAISNLGKKVKGKIKANSTGAARKILQQQHYSIVSLEEQKSLNVVAFLLKRVSMKEKIIFTEQLGVMIKSGLSVVNALKSLAEETQNQYFKEVITEIKNSVEGGTGFSAALAKYPKIFPQVFVEVVKSGEISGALDDVLKIQC